MCVFTSVGSRVCMCVKARGWHRVPVLIILNLISWDKVSDLNPSLLWGSPVSTCWMLRSKVKHHARLAFMWMLWIWTLGLALVWQSFFCWAVSSTPVSLLFEHRLDILVNIIFRENVWSSNGQATHNAGPDVILVCSLHLLAQTSGGSWSSWATLLLCAEPPRLCCLSSEDCYLVSISRPPFRVCSRKASLLSAHGRKRKQVAWKNHEEHTRSAYV